MIQRSIESPKWLTSGSIYQINPRTFSKEGTIASVTKELPFLASLGISTVYFCPVFDADTSETNQSPRQIGSGTGNPKNPYRMNDYFRIDEEYGTMDDLRECIKACHSLGMHIILDLVYFHIGPNAEILKYHPEFARQNADGSFICGGWNFPQLDFNNPGLREYLWDNMVYYIAVLDADGFRCDVGDCIPVDFWAEGRRRIRAVKHDAVLIDEGADGQKVLSAFNAVYGFSWHSWIYNAITGACGASAIRECWEEKNRSYPEGALILRDMDNHDTVTDWPERVETVAGNEGMDLIQALNHCIDGIPMVYCGNELCCDTPINLFANRFHPGRFSATPREKLMNTPQTLRRICLLRTMNEIRRKDDLLQTGKTEWIDNDKPGSVIAFRRCSGSRRLWFIGNIHGPETTVRINDCLPAEGLKVIYESGAELTSCDELKLKQSGFAVYTNF